MTAAERQEYLNRVGEWLSADGQDLTKKGEVFEARLQNVFQVSVAWNDAECRAFETGVVLLSALVGIAETKLPDLLYAISAKRAIKRMFQLLWEAEAVDSPMDNADGKSKEERAEGTVIATHAVGGKAAENPTGDIFTAKAGGAVSVAPDTKATTVTMAEQPAVPARPKHIDQYVHLLPKKTQEHAALVQGLYRELDDARQKLELLMGDKTASAADREVWAKKATKCDNTLRKILDELDAEWAKLVQSGRVVVDDLGNARTLPQPLSDSEGSDYTSSGETNYAPPLQGWDEGGSVDPLTSEQKARRRDLRKWLIDTRRGNGNTRDERVKQWYENFREYLALEGDAAFEDAKIKEAIEHYGIDVEKLKGGTVMTSQETEEEKPKQE